MAPNELKLSEHDATKVGAAIYIYGYPLITMEMTRRVTTNTAAPESMRAPMGQFAHARQYPPVTYRDVPGANADTLYSLAWLDLAKEPYVLDIPDAEGRYFMVPLLDGWAEVFQAPGSRTTGTKAQTYAITGPRWNGVLPSGLTEYKSATNMVWILGRTYADGTPEDYDKVHSFQNRFTLLPLSAYGRPYSPPAGRVDPDLDMATPTKAQVTQMDAASYFKLLAALLKDNPPTPADAPMVAEMAKIGLVPGNDWDVGLLDPTTARGLAEAPKAALASMTAFAPKAGKLVSGWEITLPAGRVGTDYLRRAFLNFLGPGWNRPEDAVYLTGRVDSEGERLNGAHRYVVHFGRGAEPPTKGCWSLTMYDGEGFFVANPLDRVVLSQRSNFNLNEDGSFDLHIQEVSPGKDKEPNWLPCPAGEFALFLRLYWPKEEAPSVLDGSWTPPPVQQLR